MEQPFIGERRTPKYNALVCTCIGAAALLSGFVYCVWPQPAAAVGFETTDSWHPTLLLATKSHYFTIDGLRYFMLDVGAGPHTALLVHGMPDDGTVWNHQVKALVAKGYRVLVPDMLGYGRSDKPSNIEPYKMDSIVKVLIAQLEVLNVSNIDIVGHDWGAQTAWTLVLTAPVLFRRHVAISIGHPNTFPTQMSQRNVEMNWYMYLNTQKDSEKLYRANDCAFFKSHIVPTHAQRDAVCERLKAAPNGFTGMVNWDRANEVASIYLGIQEGEAPYPNCTVPTLGIWSDGDVYLWKEQVTESDRYMAADWRYVQINDASHWPMIDKPDEISSAILGWFEL